MIRFLAGLATIQSVLLAWSLGANSWEVKEASLTAATLLLLPLAVAWIILEAVEHLRPRRLFDPRLRAHCAVVAWGMTAGCVGTVLTTVGLVLANERVADGLVAGLGAALGVLAVIPGLRRKHGNECVFCRYDLSATPGICPECGRTGSRSDAVA